MTNPETETPKSTTLVNYIELWTPNKDRLELSSAIALESDSIRTVSPTSTSATKKQGIAGSAWSQEAPVIMQGSSTVMEQVAKDSGLPIHGLIAIPVFREFTLVNVLVLGLSGGNGGLEIWTRDDRDELSISGSWYAGLSAFEYISRYVRFPKGAGLPGSAWKTARPKMIDGPDKDPDFIRSFDRDPAHLEQCVGLPISREYGFPASILLMLSDETNPIAKSIDIWHCESKPEKHSLRLIDSHSGNSEPWMQRACDEVCQKQATVLLEPGDSLLPNGYRFGVVTPFYANQQIEDVFVMLF